MKRRICQIILSPILVLIFLAITITDIIDFATENDSKTIFAETSDFLRTLK